MQDLKKGLDFRRPEFRYETFLRFYAFHDKYKAHPGGVYYAMPYIFEKLNLDIEERLWFCYINGLCQNVITTYEIFTNFPNLPTNITEFEALTFYFRQNYTKFGWDTDRRYVKNSFEKCIQNYINNLAGRTQKVFFNTHTPFNDNNKNFDLLWEIISENFYLFGRLSTFSYLEYLKIAGLPIECSHLFIYDIEGSKSHRNGLCKVLGRDDLDWHNSNPIFHGKYTKETLDWLTIEGKNLLDLAIRRGINASYFTLESTLCCYKSWFRKNRRYPNCYNDMFYERILRNEREWGRENTFFRQMRQDVLPKYLRIEDNYLDPGLKPLKQNWFRETGQVIMMNLDWPCFDNDFNKMYYNDI